MARIFPPCNVRYSQHFHLGWGVRDVPGMFDDTRGQKKIGIPIWLVVFRHPSEKWWTSSVGMMTFPILSPIWFPIITIFPIYMIIPNRWEKKTCSKPPTSQSLWVFFESMSAYWATASSPAAIRVKRLSLVACRETPYLWWGKKTGETPPKMGDLWGIHGISIGSWDMNGIFMGRLGCSWNVNRIYPPVTC